MPLNSTPIPTTPGFYLFVGYSGKLEYASNVESMPQLWVVDSKGRPYTNADLICTPRVGVFIPLPQDHIDQARLQAEEALFPFLVARARNNPSWSWERRNFMDSIPETLREKIEAELAKGD